VEVELAELKSGLFEPLKMRCNVQVGGFRVAFYDHKQKIAVDIHPTNFDMSFTIRQRLLNEAGIVLAVIPDDLFGPGGYPEIVRLTVEKAVSEQKKE
jgi:hypothetical protein